MIHYSVSLYIVRYNLYHTIYIYIYIYIYRHAHNNLINITITMVLIRPPLIYRYSYFYSDLYRGVFTRLVKCCTKLTVLKFSHDKTHISHTHGKRGTGSIYRYYSILYIVYYCKHQVSSSKVTRKCATLYGAIINTVRF